jgi:DNA end-binding protein Ku
VARSIWTGVISFGLVSVPVGLYSATGDHDVGFHQFQKGTSDRVRNKRVNERTGKEVPYADIVKGAEVAGDDKYVLVDPDELDSIAPGQSRSLDVHTFVDLAEIDPVYYAKTYYLAPAGDGSEKTYALLRQAMATANRAAIGTFVMRGKEYLAAIRPQEKVLILQTLYFADEVRDPAKELPTLPREASFRGGELKMANQLIDAMAGSWNPTDYRDTYTDKVKQLIKDKEKGREVVTEEQPPTATNVTDLMEMLRRSVEESRGGKKPAAGSKKPAAKRAPKATPAKKAAITPRSKKASARPQKAAARKAS